ncbi:cyclin-dependent kinase inhibitor far1 [Podila epigama]|nr:cyclin-dependent kinase inhibitor far1 [Podila epigama]
MSPQYQYGPTKAKEFYVENNVIFLTGATGFVGKTILEKLLRTFPDIKKVYLLVRISGAKTLQERVDQDVFTSRIFDTLRSQFASPQEFHQQIVQKIVPVKGDITLDRLGLSDEDLEMIQKDTRIVINSAASVSFDDPLNNALEMNTRGPFRTFEVAKGIKNLSAFVHISTCYVNAHMPGASIDEVVYPHPFGEPEAIYEMLSNMTYEELRNYERSVVLKTYPNTYTFSKSLTEHLIRHRFQDMNLPIVIVRPSIVTAAQVEPVPGWVEGVAAANKAVVSCALGQVQEWIGASTKKTDLIPVDIVAKTILLAATTADRTLSRPPIYHVGTSCLNPITWGLFGFYLCAYWRAVNPPRRRVSNDIRFEMYALPEFKQRFDRRFGDQIRTLGQQHLKDSKDAKRIKVRISKAMAVPMTFKTFASNEWFFDISNTLRLDDAAPLELKSGLRRGMDWHRYMEDYNAGVHAFILKEKVDRSIVIDYSIKPLESSLDADKDTSSSSPQEEQSMYGPAKTKEFYTDNNVVFLTGATGFVGKAILEKMLRSLPTVKKVYLLVRISGTQTLQERVDKEIIASRIFDTLKNQFASPQEFHKQIAQKIVPVKGDITLDRLGLSDEDLEMIQNDTRVVISCAASVSFNDPLNDALEMNVRGPFRTFEVAKGIKNLGAIVHISTTYVNAHIPDATMDEIIYPHPFGHPEDIYANLSRMSSDEIKDYERSVVLKTYPNTYTFSKSLTEHLIQHRFQDINLPIVIVRPSVVTAAQAEPVPGWVEGMAAANAIIVSCALGHVQEWVGIVSKKSDLIPVDIVAKSILLAATTANRTLSRPPIYHVGTSCLNPITNGYFSSSVCNYWRAATPPRDRISNDIRFDVYSPSEFKRRFKRRFGDQMQALAQDQDYKNSKEGKLAKLLISRGIAVPMVFKTFGMDEWFFDVSNTLRLDEAAPPELKSGLGAGLNWVQYMNTYNAGVQEFILREEVDRPKPLAVARQPVDNIPEVSARL